VSLGQNILNATGFQDITHSGAGFHAGTGTRWNQNHPAASEPADDPVRNSRSPHLNSRLAAHGFLSILRGFLHSGWHFIRLTVTPSDPAMLIANDDEGIKAEAPASLDYSRATPDFHHSFFNAVWPSFTISRHERSPCWKYRREF
jgi:hypothetical protein